jgi:hypothetical protein
MAEARPRPYGGFDLHGCDGVGEARAREVARDAAGEDAGDVAERRTGARFEQQYLCSVAASYDFPQDLTDAQDELRQLRAELQTLYRRVPWSVEPLDAWETHGNAWRRASRPASPGWDPQDATEIARLRKRELELAGSIVTHAFWSSLAPGDVLPARDALKHHHEQQKADASS